jgi:hypothetical protein
MTSPNGVMFAFEAPSRMTHTIFIVRQAGRQFKTVQILTRKDDFEGFC